MAEADNNFGIAGVAHTVGDPILLYTTYDYVVSIASVLAARGAGAKVINMSYSADVPAVFAWTVLPFELTTRAIRDSGTLLFASAGNSNENVDDRSCFIVCWENTLHTPCENMGVICVGGLEWNSQYRAISGGNSGSNFGTRGGVHIFAPYRVYAGQDPDFMAGGTNVGLISGTSFSSPYTAGVAALIWAANPSLSANQVWAIMRDTAHSSPDSSVPRYVNAYDAVLQATDLAVTADISSPISGRTYQKNRTVILRAAVGYVSNNTGVPVTVQWSSNRDGFLGSQIYNPGRGAHGLSYEIYPDDLSDGTHTIRVQVTAGSASYEDTVTITIENTPPTANIDQPANNTEICQGESVTFRGSAFDPNQLGGLPNSAFAWTSSINGSLGTGADLTRNNLSVGTHNITLTVTDDGGLTDTDSITFIVLADTALGCADLAPTAQITSPANNYTVYADAQDGQGWYKTITFEGMVSDPEDNISDLTVEWFTDLEGDLAPISVNPSSGFTTVTDRLHTSGCGVSHTVTLRVTDTAGNISEDQITVNVGLLC
ncbi:MAG: S8 family serine peptidase [Anaerolineales bacterium]|nr:S8 family serine peptidase [Anaerolineales bacterium]